MKYQLDSEDFICTLRKQANGDFEITLPSTYGWCRAWSDDPDPYNAVIEAIDRSHNWYFNFDEFKIIRLGDKSGAHRFLFKYVGRP